MAQVGLFVMNDNIIWMNIGKPNFFHQISLDEKFCKEIFNLQGSKLSLLSQIIESWYFLPSSARTKFKPSGVPIRNKCALTLFLPSNIVKDFPGKSTADILINPPELDEQRSYRVYLIINLFSIFAKHSSILGHLIKGHYLNFFFPFLTTRGNSSRIIGLRTMTLSLFLTVLKTGQGKAIEYLGSINEFLSVCVLPILIDPEFKDNFSKVLALKIVTILCSSKIIILKLKLYNNELGFKIINYLMTRQHLLSDEEKYVCSIFIKYFCSNV